MTAVKRLALACMLIGATALPGTAWLLDRCFPPNLSRLSDLSTTVVDRHGVALRVFTAKDGHWRFPLARDRVAPHYLELLLDTEDRRFFAHPGVDPWALARATLQRLWHGRVVSGGSTLTMQVARLLEPRPRTLRSKLIEIGRALQLEWHYDKDAILSFYLTLAPMGGNLDGVRAGSLAWLGREPSELSFAEAALLVALPQSPTRLRPDLAQPGTRAARDAILHKAGAWGLLNAAELHAALQAPVPTIRRAMPMLAPHLSERLVAAASSGAAVPTLLDAKLQSGVERLLAQTLRTLPRPVNVAAIVADYRRGEVLARAGSARYLDQRRFGMIDMTRAVRSPGSTLKPLIYAMAFDARLAHPKSLIRDEARRFDDYAPHNFDGQFNGDVTLRDALQRSLNLPAVMALKRLGPITFTSRLADLGFPLAFKDQTVTPALPLALGGVGSTLEDLTALYAGLANGGRVSPLRDTPDGEAMSGRQLASADAAAAIADILAGVPPPEGYAAGQKRLAFKTGTSYRYRDGWALGFDGRHVIGVWMGRADGGSCPCAGMAAAAILFRLFDLLPAVPLPALPADSAFAGAPPAALARIDTAPSPWLGGEPPAIAFPQADAAILIDAPSTRPSAIRLRASGGHRPYRWFVDGVPLPSRPWQADAVWQPLTTGFSTITLVDATGASARSEVRILTRTAETTPVFPAQ